jgi:hypothetical protein
MRCVSLNILIELLFNSVGDPDQDPHVFEPPGSESISSGYGSGSFPFLIKVLSILKLCLENKFLSQNFSTKYKYLRLKISNNRKIWRKKFFLHPYSE